MTETGQRKFRAPQDHPVKMEQILVKCRICRKVVALSVPEEGEEFSDVLRRTASRVIHQDCLVKERAREKAKQILRDEEEKLQAWATICPGEFRKKLDPTARGFNLAKLKMVLGWEYGDEKGLRIVGPSGLCKTRFLCQLFGREFRAGRTMGIYMHGDLRRQLTCLAASDSKALAVFVDTLIALEMLAIDDLGKGRSTPTAEEALFAIVDGRAKHCRPTFFTLNTSMEVFANQLSEEYRVPLVRRIEDKTTLLQFR